MRVALFAFTLSMAVFISGSAFAQSESCEISGELSRKFRNLERSYRTFLRARKTLLDQEISAVNHVFRMVPTTRAKAAQESALVPRGSRVFMRANQRLVRAKREYTMVEERVANCPERTGALCPPGVDIVNGSAQGKLCRLLGK